MPSTAPYRMSQSLSQHQPNDFWLLQWAHGRSFFTAIFLWGQVDVHPWASLFEHYPLLCCVREAFHPTNLHSTMGKAGAACITNIGKKLWVLKLILWQFWVMDGISKGKLGMITTFYRSDQAKVEPSDTHSTLVQWDSSKPGVVGVKVFTNLPHLPKGSYGSPYLDITTLSVSTLTTQLPLALVCLCRLLPCSCTQVIPFEREKGRWAKNLPIPHGDTLGELRRGAWFVPPFVSVSPHPLLLFQ